MKNADTIGWAPYAEVLKGSLRRGNKSVRYVCEILCRKFGLSERSAFRIQSGERSMTVPEFVAFVKGASDEVGTPMVRTLLDQIGWKGEPLDFDDFDLNGDGRTDAADIAMGLVRATAKDATVAAKAADGITGDEPLEIVAHCDEQIGLMTMVRHLAAVGLESDAVRLGYAGA